MENLFINVGLSLLTGIISGIIAGLYTAIVGVRYAAFQDNKKQILNVLRSIHYDDGYISGHESRELNKIWLVRSDFLTMKQFEAGKLVQFQYDRLVADISGKSDRNIIGEQIILDFQEAIKELQPNKIALLKFW